MPIYEYQCKNCGVFEVTQRIVEDALKECPTCHDSDLHRLISHTSFVLKGSGWYATDYASKSNTTKADTPDGAAPASSATSGESGGNGSAAGASSSSSSGGDSSSAKPSSEKSASPKPAA